MLPKLQFLALLISLLCFGCSHASETKVVLLAGQSNMAGQGNFDALDENTKQRIESASSRVFISEGGKVPKPLTYKTRPKSDKYQFENAFGPELMVGVALAERYPNSKFLLIKHARGGTSLEGAWNPNWDAQKAKKMEKGPKQSVKLYSEHVEHIKKNLSRMASAGENAKVIGLVWLQGENDAKSKDSANKYKDTLQQLVSAYRSEFNQQMPFVFAQTNSRYGEQGAAAIVRQRMAEYPKLDANSIMIPTSTDTTWPDYPKHTDNVHYNAEGQKRIGEALGKALITLQLD